MTIYYTKTYVNMVFLSQNILDKFNTFSILTKHLPHTGAMTFAVEVQQQN